MLPDYHCHRGIIVGSLLTASAALLTPLGATAGASMALAQDAAISPKATGTVILPRNDTILAYRPHPVVVTASTPARKPPGVAAAMGTVTPSPAAVPVPASASPAATYVPPPVAVSGTPQEYARSLMAQYGWGDGQFSCLDSLWTRESGWSYTADNAGSGAYGIPQALPGSKMASAGSDWATNPDTQVRWGLVFYVEPVYGTPCAAWDHEVADGWY